MTKDLTHLKSVATLPSEISAF